MLSTGGGARGVNEAIRRALKERLLAEGTPSEEVDLIIPSLSEDDEGDDDVDDGNAEGDGLNKKNNAKRRKENDNDVTNSSDKTMTTEQPVLSTSSTGKEVCPPNRRRIERLGRPRCWLPWFGRVEKRGNHMRQRRRFESGVM